MSHGGDGSSNSDDNGQQLLPGNLVVTGIVDFEEDGGGDMEEGTNDDGNDDFHYFGFQEADLVEVIGRSGAQRRHEGKNHQASEHEGFGKFREQEEQNQGESGGGFVENNAVEQVIIRMIVAVNVGVKFIVIRQGHALHKGVNAKSEHDLHGESGPGLPMGVNVAMLYPTRQLFEHELDKKAAKNPQANLFLPSGKHRRQEMQHGDPQDVSPTKR